MFCYDDSKIIMLYLCVNTYCIGGWLWVIHIADTSKEQRKNKMEFQIKTKEALASATSFMKSIVTQVPS